MPGGRPKKIIDYDRVLEMASYFATQEEIATELDLSIRKLQQDEEFMRIFKKGNERAKKSLRRKQYEIAMGGNTTMLVWLGKQYLNQREPMNEQIIPEEEQDEKMAEFDEE